MTYFLMQTEHPLTLFKFENCCLHSSTKFLKINSKFILICKKNQRLKYKQISQKKYLLKTVIVLVSLLALLVPKLAANKSLLSKSS